MLLRRYINGKPITTAIDTLAIGISWIATAKVHKREANHNKSSERSVTIIVGLLLRRYINGKPITTLLVLRIKAVELDCYCEGT